KPAYSEMDPNATRNRNRNAEEQTGVSSPDAAQQTPAVGQAPGAARPIFKRPSFLVAEGGNIQDLPDYPRGSRQNAMMGPNQGTNMMSLAITTSDPMDKIGAFYEQLIKNNRWTVVDKVFDPEFSEWSLKKGEENTAKITVKKDTQSGLMTIFIVRAEKLEEPANK
ncbi:MAG TPA: hypothetical protein VLM38_12035, partial [Blastocatellia bacterium]|nr:hypothetical protein [Blastocatellia bacterium]